MVDGDSANPQKQLLDAIRPTAGHRSPAYEKTCLNMGLEPYPERPYCGEDPRVAASMATARALGFDMKKGNYMDCLRRPPKNTPHYKSPVQELIDPRIGTAERKPKSSIW